MQVTELFDLTHWIDREIVKKQIPGKYQALQTLLQQNSQQNNQQQPFEEQKDLLLEAIGEVPLHQLTSDQLDILGKLEIAQGIGPEGVDDIEDILYKNVLDIATAAQKVNEILTKINQGIAKSDQIKTGLTGIVEIEEHIRDKAVIRVCFAGDAAMSNLTDFKKWGRIWYEIGRGVAMLHDSSPEDVKIIGVKTGSVVLELTAVYALTKTVSAIILEGLKVADKVLDILHKAEELKGLKLSNKKIARDLEKEAATQKEQGIEQIKNQLVEEFGLQGNGDGDKITALEKSIKDLVNFTEEGGEVDFMLPEEPEPSDDEDEAVADGAQQAIRVELHETIRQIKALEEKRRLLEHHSEE